MLQRSCLYDENRYRSWADAGVLKGGGGTSTCKREGPALGLMLESLHRGPKWGGVQTPAPPDLHL